MDSRDTAVDTRTAIDAVACTQCGHRKPNFEATFDGQGRPFCDVHCRGDYHAGTDILETWRTV